MTSSKLLNETKVGDLGALITMPPTLPKSAGLRQAVEAMLAHPLSLKTYVIDVEGNLVGVLTPESVMKLVADRADARASSGKPLAAALDEAMGEGVEKALQKPHPVKAATTLREALTIMLRERLSDLPVVDEDYKLIGELVGLRLLEKYGGLVTKP